MQSTFSQSFKNGVLLLLVAVLVIGMAASFGPQLDGCVQGGDTAAVRVYGESQSRRDFDAVYRVLGYSRQPVDRQRSEQLRQHVADGLVNRALLARQATELGFHADAEQVTRNFVATGAVRVSLGLEAPQARYGLGGAVQTRLPTRADDGAIERDQISQWLRYLGLTAGEFAEWQVQETLAQHMRETVVEGVSVSPTEVWAAYEREKELASVAYFRFAPRYYQDTLRIEDDALTAWMAENTEAVDQEYDNNRARFTGLPEQVRARHILLKWNASDSEEEKDAVRARARGLLRQLQTGGDFDALARENSEDNGADRTGGDLGWVPRGRESGALEEALFSLEDDEISDLVESPNGVHIVQVRGHRQGDVPEAEAKRELAERLYREARSSEMAREAAERALRDLRGGLTPEQLDRTLQGLPAEVPTTVDEEGNTVEVAETPVERGALAPSLQTADNFGQAANPIRGLESGPLVRAVFEMDDETELPTEPLQLGSEYVVFRVTNREHATQEGFDEETQTRLRGGLLGAKQREVLGQYIRGLREQADRDRAMFLNESILLYGDEDQRAQEAAEEEARESASEAGGEAASAE